MANNIIYDPLTKVPHKNFINWLNDLLTTYRSGFWDSFIQNMIELTFIRKTKVFFEELYGLDGTTNLGNLVVGNLDTVNHTLLYFDGEGDPVMYNNTDIPNILDIDAEGNLIMFYTNVAIPLYDGNATHSANLIIQYEYNHGIKQPAIQVRTLVGTLISQGYLDVPYEFDDSGTYKLEVTPLDDYQKYLVTNDSAIEVIVSIPILTDFEVQYKIRANGGSILVPNTELSTVYLKEAEKLGSLRHKDYNG